MSNGRSQYSHNSCSCFKLCVCSLPFFLVATGCHDCPVEIYPQKRGLPNCRSSGNACYALACSGPYWAYGADLGAGAPCLGAEFGFVGAVSAAGGADVALPCILHLYNPGSYITPFWGPPLCVASTVRPTFLFRTLHASSIPWLGLRSWIDYILFLI